MKVLLISHNVLSRTSNMGKTFLSYLNCFKPEEVAQIYIHSEVPTDDSVCTKYYRFTDIDALKSVIQRLRYGTIFNEDDICRGRKNSRTDMGATAVMYTAGSKRGGFSMAVRELVWHFASWNTKKLREWIKEFDPDVIFLASGNYAFIYNIAYKVADMLNKPLVVSCVDDYYFYNCNEKSFIGKITYKYFMKTVEKTLQKTASVFTICEAMTDIYEKRFGVKCYTLHTGADNITLNFRKDATKISYIGNLGFDRYKQLIEISQALQEIDSNRYIDVYSADRNNDYVTAVKNEPGIRFHGPISSEEVLTVMSESVAVIHTESFDDNMMKHTRYSVSTKIAESLMYGPCLLAYGPEGIASIDYLKDNKAAYVITSQSELKQGLKKLISDSALREIIMERARNLAHKNHDAYVNSVNVRKWLAEACEEDKHESALY